MSWWWQTKPDDRAEVPYHTSANVDLAESSITVAAPSLTPTFAAKPDDLVQALQRSSEWTRAPRIDREAPGSALCVPASETAPMVPGLYWWRPAGLAAHAGGFVRPRWSMAIVVTFGGDLMVRQRKGDSSMYTSVGALQREWAGPIALPADARLEDFAEVSS